METLAIALLGFFVTGYLVLGGADIGTGMLLPYLGRDESERRLVLTSFAPFFLGNEVWLVAAAGLFVGCFPELEGELLSGQFAVVVPLIVGWIVRDMGLWLRGRSATAAVRDGGAGRRGARTRGTLRRAACDGAVVCGSWTVALGWAWLLAALFNGSVTEPASGPAAVLTSAAVTTLFLAHGLGFAALRLTGAPFERARRGVGRTGTRQSLALTSVLMGAVVVLAGRGLPLYESAADGATLALLVPVVLVTTPLLVAVQVWLWRTFRRRVTHPSYI
ncbi:cytochrome d ubiquinol oxidase subunit II [Streptomyces sp. NRRL F-5135]|uniref:cytochrome d ubiquinol oxidase subunit II n=1 Tax=Streptomyces sp. NRRL F-5135 TaxID=1463858 RepID=UPI0004C69A97|nr:cytochrome d ubiquinol oxidase subunit II [Streptomyces sp. NRRL F-5135]